MSQKLGLLDHRAPSVIRHQNADIEQIEQLFEHHQGIDTDEVTQAVMATVLGALQYLYIANVQTKRLLDDYGRKWRHTPTQFDLNRKFFAHVHNPDDSMTVGPDIYDNYKRQVNAYGETIVYKHARLRTARSESDSHAQDRLVRRKCCQVRQA